MYNNILVDPCFLGDTADVNKIKVKKGCINQGLISCFFSNPDVLLRLLFYFSLFLLYIYIAFPYSLFRQYVTCAEAKLRNGFLYISTQE